MCGSMKCYYVVAIVAAKLNQRFFWSCHTQLVTQNGCIGMILPWVANYLRKSYQMRGEIDRYILMVGQPLWDIIPPASPPSRSLSHLSSSSQIMPTLQQVFDDLTRIFFQNLLGHLRVRTEDSNPLSSYCSVFVSYCTNSTPLDGFTNWTVIEMKLQEDVCITLIDSA